MDTPSPSAEIAPALSGALAIPAFAFFADGPIHSSLSSLFGVARLELEPALARMLSEDERLLDPDIRLGAREEAAFHHQRLLRFRLERHQADAPAPDQIPFLFLEITPCGPQDERGAEEMAFPILFLAYPAKSFRDSAPATASIARALGFELDRRAPPARPVRGPAPSRADFLSAYRRFLALADACALGAAAAEPRSGKPSRGL